MEAWWSPSHIRLVLTNRDSGEVVYSKRLNTTDTSIINPTSFAIRAYRFEANWESLEIHPGVEQVVGELGVDYNSVGVEFNAATGALYTVRAGNLLMQVDAGTGAATEIGVLEGVTTVNLSAPWPNR